MKCHYQDCQEPAYQLWQLFRVDIPLCLAHADIIHEMVPLPDVKADDLVAEGEKLAANISKAFDLMREDEEWDKGLESVIVVEQDGDRVKARDALVRIAPKEGDNV